MGRRGPYSLDDKVARQLAARGVVATVRDGVITVGDVTVPVGGAITHAKLDMLAERIKKESAQ
jgi:hypothetical protein